MPGITSNSFSSLSDALQQIQRETNSQEHLTGSHKIAYLIKDGKEYKITWATENESPIQKAKVISARNLISLIRTEYSKKPDTETLKALNSFTEKHLKNIVVKSVQSRTGIISDIYELFFGNLKNRFDTLQRFITRDIQLSELTNDISGGSKTDDELNLRNLEVRESCRGDEGILINQAIQQGVKKLEEDFDTNRIQLGEKIKEKALNYKDLYDFFFKYRTPTIFKDRTFHSDEFNDHMKALAEKISQRLENDKNNTVIVSSGDAHNIALLIVLLKQILPTDARHLDGINHYYQTSHR